MSNFATKLRTNSGLAWKTILKYAKSELLERDDDDRPVYLHSKRCPSFCDYACNGEQGAKIAEDVETLEGFIPSDCWSNHDERPIMPDDTKKLIDEIERWLNGGSPQSGYILLRDESRVVIAALRAVEQNKTDAAIMKLVRKCHGKGFTCRNPGGRFGEDDCGKCEACKLAAALASQPAPPAATCGEEGRGR